MTARLRIEGQGPSAPEHGACERVISRFAPSPTGRLHLGHALSALRAHDLARSAGGKFLLRIEDIDGARSRPEHVETIVDDLAWLGLSWDGPIVFQSDRLAFYDDALSALKARALVYPCFCTRAEIAASVVAPHEDVAPYSGTCRAISTVEREARMREPHCWRLDVARAMGETGLLRWCDAHAGEQAADPLPQGDVVLARKDAPGSYHLAVSVDDAAQGVTDVVRSIDLFTATHVHRLLQALLDLPTPRYYHHPLVTDTHGQRLAKRHRSPTLAAMRLAGENGRALADQLRMGIVPIGFALASA